MCNAFQIVGPLRGIEEIEDCETEIPDDTNRFAICISNDDYAVSLAPLKIYPVIADPRAEENGMIRIIDDSGEDYLYSSREIRRLHARSGGRAWGG
jgi:hypothetical protein